MVQKLKIIPLGGLGEIGKNMTVFEYGNDSIVVDCGMGFPDEDMYGIDVVLPDISYLKDTRITSARCPMCSRSWTCPSTPRPSPRRWWS